MKRHIASAVLLGLILPASAQAQFFSFGRNKVQYTDFAWTVLKTEHFDIYYYPEMKDLAERGAFLAEESYHILEQKFNHSLTTRIPLIFYSSHLHFQQTNTTAGFIPEGVGGFFEFLKGRVVIPSDGSTAQFSHVIRHELVHVFMQSKLNKVLSDHRKTTDRTPPLWFVEGLAEYWSTTWDDQAEMVIRDMVLNNTIVGLEDMDRIYGTFLMYKEGQNALQFLSENYGEGSILLLMENFWKDNSFNTLFTMTIGKGYREFDEEWLYALKKRYYPLLASHDASSRSSRTLVKDGFNTKPVVFEIDTVRDLYFIADRTGYTGIYRRSLDSTYRLDPGKEILEGEKSDEFEEFHPLGGRFDISRKGQLAFVTKSGETDALHLYNVHSATVVRDFAWPSIVSMGSVSWAPDSRRLVFSAIDKSGNSDLYLLDTEAGEVARLTNDLYDDRDPAWSPDGASIAFCSDRTPYGTRGVKNLFLYSIANGTITYLTYGPESIEKPAWSKDGRFLAFTSNADGVQNIWMTSIRDSSAGPTRSARQITRFTTSAFDPAWTSSGDLIFSSFENLRFELRAITNVEAVFDTSTIIRTADLRLKDKPWQPRTIEGTSELQRLKYQGDYSVDVAQSTISTNPVFGTTGGAVVALSDLLGNEQYDFLLYNTAETRSELLSSFNIAVSRVSLSQRANYAYGVYRFAGPRYDITQVEEFYYERVFGGFFTLSYPLDMFRRVETTVSLSNSTKETDGAVAPRNALLLSNSVSFIQDNSLWGPTGPLDGSRFAITLAYTSDIQYSNVDYYSIILDYRHYLRLSTRSALASRFWVFYNDGKESRRFVMGGSWDLRGYPRWSIKGEKLWLVSNELRFPFIDQFRVQFPFGGASFFGFMGALFFDAGNAWDTDYSETLGSVGGGLRFNLGNVVVLRYDVGKRIEDNFHHFQSDWFQQFFFGWDF